MFPGGSHGEKQDLFSEESDQQKLFTDEKEVPAFEQNVFTELAAEKTEDQRARSNRPELSAEGRVSQSLVQEILSGNRDTQHVVQEILTGECFAFYMDENFFSKEPTPSSQNVFEDSRDSRHSGAPSQSRSYNIPSEHYFDEHNEKRKSSGGSDEHNIAGRAESDQETRVSSSPGQEVVSGQQGMQRRGQCPPQDLFSREFSRGHLSQRPPPRQLDMELDLDYLERRGEHARAPRGPPPEAEASPDSMDLVKVILLGAPAVGKTSIIQQFVWNDFSEEYIPTDRKHTYYPSVIINDHLYELKISDIPVIPYFPVNSYYEWTDYRFYGLRSATAYVLVFDLSNADTFQYIRTLRDQMLESRDMRNVPLLVVGNKQDLLVSSSGTGGASGGNGGAGGSGASGSGGGAVAIAGSSSGGTSGRDVEYREKRRDIVNLVKKHWKCTYVECSAKYNWRVVAVFKELMRAVDSLEMGQTNKEVCSPMMDNIHDALDRNKCNIL